MNIIELFDKLELNRDAIAGYLPGDVIRVEKQLNVERKINPEIDANTASNLIQAIRYYAAAFVFVLSSRHLYNFFTGKDLPRKHFPEFPAEVDADTIRDFIARFLADDLELRLDKALSADRFGTIRDLLAVADYLPEESLHRLERRMTGKLEFAIGRMPREGKIDVSGIDYMRLMSFYEILSYFSSIEMDDKIRIVINRTSDMYNTRRERKFASDVMVCLPSYKAFDDDLNRVTSGNRGVVSSNADTFSGGKSSSGSNVSGRVVFIVILLVLKLVVFTGKCANDSADNYEYSNDYGTVDSGLKIDSGYTYEMRQNDVKAAEFADYLAMYDRDSVRNVKLVDTIKTGENPFKHLFTQKLVNVNNLPGDDATFANRTPYDLVLLEFADKEGFNMPSYAYYIKSGHKFTVKVTNQGAIKQDYAFYFGNDLASFKADGNEILRPGDGPYEFRFRNLAPYAREILKKKFRFSHDVVITKDGGQLKLKSEGLEGVTDSLTTQGEYVF